MVSLLRVQVRAQVLVWVWPFLIGSLMKPRLFLGLSELSYWDSSTIFKVNIQTLLGYSLVFSGHCVFTKPSTSLSALTSIPA